MGDLDTHRLLLNSAYFRHSFIMGCLALFGYESTVQLPLEVQRVFGTVFVGLGLPRIQVALDMA